MVILDTSVIIDHLRTKATKSLLMTVAEKEGTTNLAISTISIQELYTGKSTRNILSEQALKALLSPFKIHSYTYEIAILAGIIERDSQHLIGFADAAIAATAIHHQIPLLTLNTKDFEKITKLILYPH